MSEIKAAARGPEEPGPVPGTATGGTHGTKDRWNGPTYYGRPALKAAPFNAWVVGGYVFLAGLSGASSILATIADFRSGRQSAAAVRLGRYLPLLAPSVGGALLIYDLHTPQRFYNMFRVAKRTSPMSIGTWILSAFSVFSGAVAGLQFLSERAPGLRWIRGAARVASVPTALTGAGMSTYTAALLSATSTPLWAVAPRALAARFGSSSLASGAAALSLAEAPGPTRSALDMVTCAALALELVADGAFVARCRQAGIAGALGGGWGAADKLGASGLGAAVPLALHGLALATGNRDGNLSRVAALLVLGGSCLLRVSTIAAGSETARDPETSFRFAQPDNLPRRRSRRRVASQRNPE